MLTYYPWLKIEELWESMCSAAISLTSKALNEVSNAEILLKIKGFIALFIQTMEVRVSWSVPTHR